VQDVRTLACNSPLQRRLQIFTAFDALTFGPVGLGELDEVRVVWLAGVLADELCPGMSPLENELHRLSLDSELGVVDDYPDRRKVVLDGSTKDLRDHVEGAVTGHRDGRLARVGDRCTKNAG